LLKLVNPDKISDSETDDSHFAYSIFVLIWHVFHSIMWGGGGGKPFTAKLIQTVWTTHHCWSSGW